MTECPTGPAKQASYHHLKPSLASGSFMEGKGRKAGNEGSLG